MYINSNNLYLHIRCIHEPITITYVVTSNTIFPPCPIIDKEVLINDENKSIVDKDYYESKEDNHSITEENLLQDQMIDHCLENNSVYCTPF